MHQSEPTSVTNQLPLVAVGILAYNRPSGIRHTLDAICGQTYPNLMIYVSDDCSPNPEVYEIIESFSEKDSRVQGFRQEKNIGIIRNHEFLLSKFPETAKYWMWACDDDDWHPNYVGVCVDALEKHPEAILCATEIGWKDQGMACRLNHPEHIQTLGVEDPANRYKKVLAGILWWNHAFYGVITKHAYEQVRLKFHFSFDILFIAQLSLLGAFIKLPQPYFTKTIRGYGNSMESNLKAIQVREWLTRYFPRIRMIFTLIGDIWKSGKLKLQEKIDLSFHVITTVAQRRIYDGWLRRKWWKLREKLVQ